MLYAAQQFLNGFHSAALYALLAFGYALMFGLHRRVDFAYGGLYALCGQLTVLGAVFGYRALWMTLPAALAFGIAIAFLVALILQDLLARQVLVPLFHTAPNAIAVASLGALIMLTELGRIAADSRDWWLPPLGAPLAVPLPGGRIYITPAQVAGIGVATALIAAAHGLLRGTPAGRRWRAVADDPFAAALLGIDPARVVRQAAAVSASLGAVAGAMTALHYGNVSLATGLVFAVKIVFIAALAGNLSPLSSAGAGALLGMAEAMWTGWFPSEWRDAAMLGGLCAFLVLTGRARA